MTICIEEIFDDDEGILDKSIFAISIAFFAINNIFVPDSPDIIISLVAKFLIVFVEMFVLLIAIYIVDPDYGVNRSE